MCSSSKRVGRRPPGEAHLDPGHLAAVLPRREKPRRVAALDRAARVALELVAAADPQVARHRQEPARDALGVGAGVPDLVGRGIVVWLVVSARASPASSTRSPTARCTALIWWSTSIMRSLLLRRVAAARRLRLPRASSVPSAVERAASTTRRKRSSHASTSRSGSCWTAYRRRVPSGRTVAKPCSRRTLRCCETAGWEMPNSCWMTAQTAPDGPLAVGEQLEDPAAHRVAERR